jgi:hypothetical protein
MVVEVAGLMPVVDVVEFGGSVTVVVVTAGSVDGTVEDGTVDDGGTVVDDVVVVVATPVSGDTHPAGGVVGPVCPGINTVPAHPKSENVDSLVVVEPSEKCATERVWRMYPEASTDTSVVVPV